VAHLYHFCALLPPQQYVDLRPAFTFKSAIDTGLINGAVILPNCLSSSVRYTSGRKWWRTERAAMKDAAFQAYIALFGAGLLNENLLPLSRVWKSENDAREELSSTIEISDQFNPWLNLAKAWSYPNLHQTLVSLQQHKESEGSELLMVLTTPTGIPLVRPFPLYWDSETTYVVRLESPRRATAISSDHLQITREITHTLLRSTHSDYKTEHRMDFVALFAPDMENDQIATWLRANRGRRLALEEFQQDSETPPRGLVRSPLVGGIPHIFGRWRRSCADGTEAEVEVECSPLPRRRNFLHCGMLAERLIDVADEEKNSSPRKVRAFPARSCTVDLLPFELARFSLFIPAILQHMEVLMVADQLCQTVIKDVPFKDIHHVVAAISASSAHWVTNYQRYEFLGDSMLKFIVSSQLFVDHWNWHEGYLSESRASFVSNSRLTKAALNVGLDAFVLTKSFTGRKWIPPLVSDVGAPSTGRRSIPSKVLADVVEALIGAAFIDGSFSSARACIHTFLPDIHIQAPTFGLMAIGEHSRRVNPTNALADGKAELLIGYRFLDKALLVEALTHPSCERDTFTESYQRLEFLGDAVLDIIVVTELFEHNPDLSHGDMTSIKAALVNADLLAFLCMEISCAQDTVEIQQKNGKFCAVHEEGQIELWKFMRHHSQEIMKAQQACLKRHQLLRRDVENCLNHGKSYPWALLVGLNANKFYSDIVESVLGGIFVDSKGNLDECQRFAERIGIFPYLRRIIVEGIDVVHPKTALGRLTGPDKIEYIVECEEGVHSVYRCLVRVKDSDIIAVGGCLTKDEAIVKAAHAAVEVISYTTAEVC
jgi:dsRNA-specific ribonuclease